MRKITTLLFALCVAVSMAQAKSQASAPANKPNIQPDAQRPIATRLKNSPALVKAAQANNLEKVKKLLDQGADPNSVAEIKEKKGDKYKFKFKPLEFAVKNNNMEMVETLLDAGADIDSSFMFGVYRGASFPTPLIYAIETGNEDLAKTFIDKGADINKGIGGDTALSAAISKNNTKLMSLLLDKGATVTAKALSNADEEQLNLFLGKGIDINTKDKDGKTALLYALYDGNHKKVVLLISRGADIYVVGPEGTAIDYAMKNITLDYDGEIVRFLSQKGVKINGSNNSKLLLVASACDKKTIHALANAGLKDFNYSYTTSGVTRSVLDSAAHCKNGTYELLSYLGADTGEHIAQQRGKSTLEKIDSVVNVVGGAALGAVAVRAEQKYTPKTTKTVTTTVVEEGVEAVSNATATTCAEQCRQSAAANAHIHYRGATGTPPYCTCDVCDDRLQKC